MENPADAFAFRNRLGEVMHTMLLPKMELLMDEIGANGKVYRIDRLDIDLGTIPVDNWERVLVDKAMDELKKLLVLQNPVWSDQNSNVTVKGMVLPDSRQAEKEAAESPDFKFTDILIHYLQTGFLPWYVTGGYRLSRHFTEWLETQPTQFFQNYIPLASVAEIRRLVYFAGDQQSKQILSFLYNEKDPAFADLALEAIKWLTEKAGPSFGSDSWFKKQLYHFLFSGLASQSSRKDKLDLFSKKISMFLIKHDAIKNITNLLPLIGVVSGNPVLGKVAEQIAINNKKQDNRIDEGKDERDKAKKEPEYVADILGNKALENFVENAGLVLLHPFLSNLFEAIQLTVQNKFVNEIAENKAILLCQYLVTGQIDCEDHQLILSKILCGYPVNRPVLCDLPFLEKELFEADDLLAQVIKMWTKNGVQVNGTVSGFREAFLQRAGKLVSKDNDWQLKVEQKPYDLVMASLPWGIGMIKTKWMKGMLWVEWA